MDAQTAVYQFCTSISINHEEQLNRQTPVDGSVAVAFDPGNDGELGKRLISHLRENRLPFFREALIKVRDFISVAEEMPDDLKQLQNEADEVLEDVLSLLGLVDFTVDNSKSEIPPSIEQNIGRLFRRIPSNLYNLVTYWESMRKNRALKNAEKKAQELENKKFWKMMKWVAVEAMLVTAGVGVICASPPIMNALTPLLTNLQSVVMSEAAAEGVVLPLTVISTVLNRR